MRVLRRYDCFSANNSNSDTDDRNEITVKNNNNKKNEDEEITKEKFWWLCENCETQKIGLVPRNYLSLYPIRRHWKRNNFVYFELNAEQFINNDFNFQKQKSHHLNK